MLYVDNTYEPVSYSVPSGHSKKLFLVVFAVRMDQRNFKETLDVSISQISHGIGLVVSRSCNNKLLDCIKKLHHDEVC